MVGAARSTIFQLGSAIGIAMAIALVGPPETAGSPTTPARGSWASGRRLRVIVLGLYPAHRIDGDLGRRAAQLYRRAHV
jgi:hypothetical protein